MLTLGSARTHAPRWSGQRVVHLDESLAATAAWLPRFDRYGFWWPESLGSHVPWAAEATANTYADVIVRLPDERRAAPIPVAVVSKSYRLVQHTTVAEMAIDALAHHGFAPDRLRALTTISEYGERMHLKILVPELFDPGDGHQMALTIECLNSVDRTRALQVIAGWFRFICSNGLYVGRVLGSLRRRHIQSLPLERVHEVIRASLARAAAEQRRCTAWQQTRVSQPTIAEWADGTLRKAWGATAAARALHIIRTGQDALPDGRIDGRLPPSRMRLRPVTAVPGSAPPNDNLFAVSQTLSWLAGTRLDVDDRLLRLATIPRLLSSLSRAARARNVREAGGPS